MCGRFLARLPLAEPSREPENCPNKVRLKKGQKLEHWHGSINAAKRTSQAEERRGCLGFRWLLRLNTNLKNWQPEQCPHIEAHLFPHLAAAAAAVVAEVVAAGAAVAVGGACASVGGAAAEAAGELSITKKLNKKF